MSATFVREHSPEDFAAIIAELERKPLQVNHDRTVAGKGRSQAFGVIRRWSYRPWLSRNTWMHPELWALLLEFAAKFDLTEYDAIQVNDNYHSNPHYDKGNAGDSYIVAFGDFSGGELNCAGTSYDIRLRGHTFCGAEILHSTAPWLGHRYSLVFFNIEWPTKFLPRYTVSCRTVADGMEVSDTYDNSVIILDRKGHIVRTVKQGKPVEWIGKLTMIGQKSRQSLTGPPTPEHDHNEA
jgi:hypothetical protein